MFFFARGFASLEIEYNRKRLGAQAGRKDEGGRMKDEEELTHRLNEQYRER
jgi:hypothetical protein